MKNKMASHTITLPSAYAPSSRGWLRCAQHDPLQRPLDGSIQPPTGFPPRVDGSISWSGAGRSQNDFLTIELDDADRIEIEEALASFKG
jgi:hypothetical protein